MKRARPVAVQNLSFSSGRDTKPSHFNMTCRCFPPARLYIFIFIFLTPHLSNSSCPKTLESNMKDKTYWRGVWNVMELGCWKKEHRSRIEKWKRSRHFFQTLQEDQFQIPRASTWKCFNFQDSSDHEKKRTGARRERERTDL